MLKVLSRNVPMCVEEEEEMGAFDGVFHDRSLVVPYQ